MITAETLAIGAKPDEVRLPVGVSKAGVVHEYPLCSGLNKNEKILLQFDSNINFGNMCKFWMQICGLLLQRISWKAFYVQEYHALAHC